MKASLVPKAWQGYPFNTIQPQQTVTGRVIYKRTKAFDKETLTHSPTDYFVTLQLHGARKEFSVDADAYGQLTVGDSGSITYQGNWLLQFARHSRRGWEVIQSQPQKGPVWRLVFISLVVVVFIALMMGGCGSDETLSMTATTKGRYTISGNRLHLTLDDGKVTLAPTELWEKYLAVTDEDFLEGMRDAYPISGTWHITDGKLTLTDDEGEKTLFNRAN